MNELAMRKFLQLLGAANFSVTGEWMTASCPLARWTHQSGRDSHPSFGVTIGPKTSVYKCFTCGKEAAPIEDLIWRIARLSGEYPRAAAEILTEHEVWGEEDKGKIKDKWAEIDDSPEITPAPTNLLSGLKNVSESTTAMKFIASRGISVLACERYDVKWSPLHEAIVFPMKNGETVVRLKARSVKEKRFFHLHSGQKGGWFGFDQLDWRKPVWILESETDILRLATLGFFNATAAGGANITKQHATTLPCTTLVLALDADDAGRRATKQMIDYCKTRYFLFSANWMVLKYKDAGELKSLEELDIIKKEMVRVF